MKDFDGIIFDMDGVILDSEKAVMDVWLLLARKYGLKNMEEVYLKCTGVNAQKTKEIMLEFYGNDFPYDKYRKEASEMFFGKYNDYKIPLKNGVFELLDFLRENNKKIILCSSTKKELVTKELEANGVLKYFDVLVTGDMVNKSKPEPDIFLKAIEESKINVDKLYVIEDSYNGVRSANSANLKTIMVPDLIMPDDEMKKKAYVIKNNLLEVIDYLNE